MSTFDRISFIDPNTVIEVDESTRRDLVGQRVIIGDFCRGRGAAFSEEQETGRLLVQSGPEFIAGQEVTE